MSYLGHTSSSSQCHAVPGPHATMWHWWHPALALVAPAPLCLYKASPRTSSGTCLCQPTPGTTGPPQKGACAGGDTAEWGGGHAVPQPPGAHLHLLDELLLIQGTGQVPLVPQDENLQGRTGDT